jgi:hypothetical protein
MRVETEKIDNHQEDRLKHEYVIGALTESFQEIPKDISSSTVQAPTRRIWSAVPFKARGLHASTVRNTQQNMRYLHTPSHTSVVVFSLMTKGAWPYLFMEFP